MKNIIKLIVKESEIDQRVDVFINKQESSLSRTRIKNLILKEKFIITLLLKVFLLKIITENIFLMKM